MKKIIILCLTSLLIIGAADNCKVKIKITKTSGEVETIKVPCDIKSLDLHWKEIVKVDGLGKLVI